MPSHLHTSFLVVLFGLAASARLALSTGACNNLSTWTITDLTFNFGESSGTASLNIGSSSSNTTESLTCRLVANSFCRINGVPSDKDLQIYLQNMSDMVYVMLNQTVACDDRAYVIGAGEFPLACEGSTDAAVTMTCVAELVTIQADPGL